MKIFSYLIIGGVVLVGAFYALNSYIYNEKQATAAADYKDAEYIIDGARVKLEDGIAETEAAPGSSARVVTRYFGNELTTDLDGDGREDVVFLLTQEPGGSGTFYYVVAALNTERGYVGSEGLLLGDRIAPQTTELSKNPSHKSVVVVNYADRGREDPFTTPPYVGKSIWLKLDPQSRQFGEVEQNFEGEANPATMTLGMKTWVWVSALYNDERIVTPKTPGVFTITFGKEGRFTTTTDCNSMAGKYVADAEGISFSEIISTKKYCEGSQENEFATLLETASGYHFTTKGELILDLKFDSGSVVFR